MPVKFPSKEEILLSMVGKTIRSYKLGPESAGTRTVYDWVMLEFTDGTSVMFHERGQVGEIMLTSDPE